MNKGIFAIIVSLFVMNQAQAMEPTFYSCEGNGYQVSYAVSSFTGQPQFYFGTTAPETGMSFQGEQIEVQDTILGKNVSVSYEFIPDYKNSSATLIIPGINLLRGKVDLDFDTVLVLSEHFTSIGGPALVNGLLDSSKFVPVSCKAQVVFF